MVNIFRIFLENGFRHLRCQKRVDVDCRIVRVCPSETGEILTFAKTPEEAEPDKIDRHNCEGNYRQTGTDAREVQENLVNGIEFFS